MPTYKIISNDSNLEMQKGVRFQQSIGLRFANGLLFCTCKVLLVAVIPSVAVVDVDSGAGLVGDVATFVVAVLVVGGADWVHTSG